MKLISLSIANFGKLHNYDLTLTDGLNTVCEENGWGKTTLAAFLKAMFYGLPKSTKRDLDENDYKRYTPWQGGSFGGNLVFSCEKGTFRVERTFGENESFALYDTATELPSTAFSEPLGNALFGIDAEGFEQSVFLSVHALKAKDGNDTVRAKLTGIDEIHDMSSYEKAFDRLDGRAKDYKKRGGAGYIGETEAKISALKEKLSEARSKTLPQENSESELAAVRGQIARWKQEEKDLQRAYLRADRIKDLLALKEKLDELSRRKEELEKQFPGAIPSREELAACRKWIEETELCREKMSTIGLTREEQDEIVSLSRRFSAGAPGNNVLTEKLRFANDLRTEQAQIDHEAALTRQALQTAENQLAALPELRELEQANELLNSRQTAEKAVKKPLATVFFILSLLLLPTGLVLLIPGILQSVQPLLYGGIAALGAGVFATACSILLAVRQKRAGRNQQTHVTAEINRVLQRLRIPENQDPHAAIALLCAQRASAESSREEAAAKCEELEKKQQQCQRKAEELRAFLAGYEITDPDPASGLWGLSKLSDRWDTLWKKQKAAVEAEAQLKAQNAEMTGKTDAFFARCPASGSSDPRDRLEAVEALCTTHKQLATAIAERREELAAKLAENGIADLSRLEEEPNASALAEKQREIEIELTLLGKRETDLSTQLGKLATATEQIPEWEEELTRLGEQLAEQKKHYELLTATRDLLKKAHDDLTTRYLPATRAHFAEYLALLCGKNVPKATLAADFSVSVQDSGISRQSESYSRGWRDLLQFCVRLSLIDALYAEGGETPFLLLDDPFTNLDEERLAAAKDLLRKLAKSRQILYLVCHADRA